jgi:acetolactate synthase-1/2/3 large subunit
MIVSDYIMKYLEKQGIEHAFILAGGASMYLLDSLKKSKIKYTCMLHEQACAIASESYNQYKNALKSVVIVTTGVGVLNTLTGVAGGYVESTPMLIISGHCKESDMMTEKMRQKGIQELDTGSIMRNLTKLSYTISSNVIKKSRLSEILNYAYYKATEKRKGPVYLNIPLNVQSMQYNQLVDTKKNIESLKNIRTYSFNEKYVLDKLTSAEKPVILIGNGVRLSNSITKFLKLISSINIPVLTTWKMADIEHYSVLFYGRPGIIAQRHPNLILQESDLLLAIGARLDMPTIAFNFNNFAKNAKHRIIVDVDETELYKHNETKENDIFICYNANRFIDFLLNNTNKLTSDYTNWINRCNELRNKHFMEVYNNKSAIGFTEDCISTYKLVEYISKNTNEEHIIIVCSSGQGAEITYQSFISRGQRLYSTLGTGSMGFGLPASIGAAIASNKKVILIQGDGGLQMNIQELQTLYRLNLDIKIFVLDNGGYASIKSMQDNLFASNYINSTENDLTLPNIRNLAVAYNIQAESIWSENGLDNILRILDCNNPYIININTNPNQKIIPKVISTIKNGEVVAGKLENMYPYLEK